MEKMTKDNVVKLSYDVFHGTVSGNYSVEDSKTTLRNALIAANGGSTVMSYKQNRRNGVELFEILEEALPRLVIEGLQGDEFFMNFVEERNFALGDTAEFTTPVDATFIVAEIANGVATPRRQRLGEKTKVMVRTAIRGIRIYEELSRVMAGRVDWNDFVAQVTEAVKRDIMEMVYAAFSGLTAATLGLSDNYVVTGTYSEENLLKIVDHVEAATGKSAIILGTKPALRKCKDAEESDQSKADRYNMGYYGKVAGVPTMYIRNRHKAGTEEFLFPDDKLYIITGDEKFVKLVHEGEATIRYEDGGTNGDMSMEYLYIEAYGVAIMLTGKIGIYTLE